MTEWTVFGVIAALATFTIAIVTPIIKLNGTITKLSVILENVLQRIEKLESQDDVFKKERKEAHEKIHNRIDSVEEEVNDHEKRIFAIERREGIQ